MPRLHSSHAAALQLAHGTQATQYRSHAGLRTLPLTPLRHTASAGFAAPRHTRTQTSLACHLHLFAASVAQHMEMGQRASDRRDASQASARSSSPAPATTHPPCSRVERATTGSDAARQHSRLQPSDQSCSRPVLLQTSLAPDSTRLRTLPKSGFAEPQRRIPTCRAPAAKTARAPSLTTEQRPSRRDAAPLHHRHQPCSG